MQTSARSQYFVTVGYCINRGPACLSAKMPTAVGKTPDMMFGFCNKIKAIGEQTRSRARMLSMVECSRGESWKVVQKLESQDETSRSCGQLPNRSELPFG